MNTETRFTVLPEHLALLRAANVDWSDTEFGAPRIDPKRPYGNSSVLSDIAAIVNPAFAEMTAAAAEDWLDCYGDGLERLHRETETVLRIGLHTGRFEPGEYVLVGERYSDQRWERAS